MSNWPWNFPQVSTRTFDHTEALEWEWQTIIRKQAARIEELETLLEAPTKEEIALYARIEALQAALRKIIAIEANSDSGVDFIARAALDKDANHD
jgi:hypothetical protein